MFLNIPRKSAWSILTNLVQGDEPPPYRTRPRGRMFRKPRQPRKRAHNPDKAELAARLQLALDLISKDLGWTQMARVIASRFNISPRTAEATVQKARAMRQEGDA